MPATERHCPKCLHPGLVYSDDPDQEGWESTVEWDCPKCGYHAMSDFDLEQEELYEGDDDDFYEDDDEL